MRLALLAALLLAAPGCASIYSRTRSQLPPDSGAALALRIEEAGRAERAARQAGIKLARSLERAEPEREIGIDLDRLEVAAFDFERRARAARDAFDGCGQPSESTGEIERLNAAARRWVRFVQAARQAGPTVKLEELRDLAR
jgi:hypothetical protein